MAMRKATVPRVMDPTRLRDPTTDSSLSRRERAQVAHGGQHNQPTSTYMITTLLAEVSGSIQGALGCLGAALGVGIVGTKAVEAVGRNPGASGKILVQAIIGMALAEAVAFYALFLGK